MSGRAASSGAAAKLQEAGNAAPAACGGGSGAGDDKVISGDTVCLREDPTVLGLVSESPDEEDEDEGADYDEPDPLVEGQVRVCWLDGMERVEDAASVQVVDRALMHGDIVLRQSDPLGQTGHVVGVKLWLDVEGPDKVRLDSVPSSRLQHIRPMRAGLYVVCRAWLGRVLDVSDAVTVQFDDGSVCKVNQANPDRLFPFNCDKEDIFADEDQSPYYPGQHVSGDSAHVFRHAKWLKGSFRGKLDGVVVNVEPGEVEVEWLVCCPSHAEQARESPDEIANPRDLTVFSYFSYTCWQLGDRALIGPGHTLADLVAEVNAGLDRPADASASKAEDDLNEAEVGVPQTTQPAQQAASQATPGGTSGSNTSVRKPEAGAGERGCEHSGSRSPSVGLALRGRRRRGGGAATTSSGASRKKDGRKAISIPDVLQVVGTRTVVDIQWQDGTISKEVPAKELAPVVQFGDHDLWPDLFVEEVGDEEGGESHSAAPRRTGIVRKMDPESRMATVTWLRCLDNGRLEQAGDNCVTEQVSVYELREHSDLVYRLGDVVLRLAESAGNTDAREATEQPLQGGHGGAKDAEEAEAGGGEEAQPSESDGTVATLRGSAAPGAAREADDALSWVGEVVGVSCGRPRICWATGQVSEVSPESIFVVSRDDDPMDGDGSVSEFYGSDSSWETLYDGEGSEEDGVAFDNLDEHDQIALRWQMEEAMQAEAQLWQNVNDGEAREEAPTRRQRWQQQC